ncbi:MAG TPA: PH domain-containing protein [bacterium]|nr:PH domain-containing protein [bacterium]
MSNLLLELKGNPEFNHTIWPPKLFVYDDLLIYKKRSWFILREITISYNQIARVTLSKSLLFAHLEIETTGTDNIRIKYISKSKGNYAKNIIDQKIYRSHAKHNAPPDNSQHKVISYERSMNRLKELENKGKISHKEYIRQQNDLLKKLKEF